MRSLCLQYDGKITDDRFVWAAEASHLVDQSPRQILDLLEEYEYQTLNDEQYDELETLEITLAAHGFYFTDCIEDLPAVDARYEPVDEGDNCD